MEPSILPKPRTYVALQARLEACLRGEIVSDPRTEPYYRRILGLDGGPWRETANYQLRVPIDWPDDCADMPLPWAANNRRRRQAARGLWPKEKGWWMHLEVPYQGPTWHWDCGAVRRARMLAMAGALAPKFK